MKRVLNHRLWACKLTMRRVLNLREKSPKSPQRMPCVSAKRGLFLLITCTSVTHWINLPALRLPRSGNRYFGGCLRLFLWRCRSLFAEMKNSYHEVVTYTSVKECCASPHKEPCNYLHFGYHERLRAHAEESPDFGFQVFDLRVLLTIHTMWHDS